MRLTSKSTIALLVFTCLHLAAAQDCFYPNGELSPGDASCLPSGGQCCPYQWDCLSNGLCRLPNGTDSFLFGRYTCTDQSWQSTSCMQRCTNNNTASGDEALLQCDDGSWCCDGDRSWDCCSKDGTEYFDLPAGNSIAKITNPPTPTSAPSLQTPNSPASTTDRSGPDVEFTATPYADTSTQSSSAQTTTSTSSSSSITSSRSSPTSTTQSVSSTITTYSVITDFGGSPSTVTLVSTVPVAAPPDVSLTSSPQPASQNHLALIVGLAVGVPVGILACALLGYLIGRRRKSKKQQFTSPPGSDDADSAMKDRFGYQVGHEAPDGRAPEIDSYPVAMGRSKSNRKSELEGSTHSPVISVGSTAHLPGYSPMSPGVRSVNEEPAELWGGYVPYRPTVTQVQEEEPRTS